MLHMFESLTQENFSFLVSEYGFHLDNANTNSVHWSRGMYHIEMSYHRYELDLYLYYDNNEYSPSYSLSEIQQLKQLVDIRDTSYIYMASTPERLSQGILEISSLFRNICKKMDIFNKETFEMLAIIRRNYSEECAMKGRISRFNVEEENIWKAKKYAELVILYENNQDILTNLQKKRLAYATKQKKHLNEP